jgi:hypothetical protein
LLDTREHARLYRQAGLSVIPILGDTSKAPAVTWKPHQSRFATDAELERWYAEESTFGIAIVCGKISGNLELLDFDRDAEIIFPAWCFLVESEAPDLLGRLNVVKTPRPGFHVRYRCQEVVIPGNTKLAQDPNLPADDRTFIETRGEGGYGLAPGSPARCHETGRLYEHHSGPDLEHLETITAAEREILWRAARSFDRSCQEPSGETSATKGNRELLPGEDFSRRGPDWAEILAPHGWVMTRQVGASRYWRRPGKGRGWSATTGVCSSSHGWELLAVFSSNAAPFEGPAGGKPCSCYSRFAAFALLNHGGDFRAAARALAEQGYGERRTSPGGAALTVPENPPDYLVDRAGDFKLLIAKQRTKWRVVITRGEDVLGVGVANLADVKDRRSLIRSLQNVTPEEVEALTTVLVQRSVSIERDWAEHERRAAERRQCHHQEQAEQMAAEAEERRRQWLQEVEAASRGVLADPALLYRVGEALRGRGLVGERENGLLLYLCVLSQITGEPISAAVKGDSSGGKSHLVKAVLEVVPDQAHIDLTSMSEKALIYDEREYAHRTVVIYEAHGEGGEFSSYLIRTLISEGQIRHLTVESTPLGLVGREIIKQGPTNFITTTTLPEMHAENETRIWTLLVDDSPSITSGVLAMQANRARGAFQAGPVDDLHATFTWLQSVGAKEAVIPFADTLAQAMPDRPLRLRRDFPRLLQLIKVCALLHQRQRQRDVAGRVIADLADYAMIRELVVPIFLRAVAGVTEKTMELVEALQRVLDDKARKGGDRDKARASYSDLVGWTGKPKHYVSRWLRPALQIGLVDNENAGENGRAAALKMGKFSPEEGGDVLPAVEDLARQLNAAPRWVSPISGQEVALHRCNSDCNGMKLTQAPSEEEVMAVQGSTVAPLQGGGGGLCAPQPDGAVCDGAQLPPSPPCNDATVDHLAGASLSDSKASDNNIPLQSELQRCATPPGDLPAGGEVIREDAGP